MNELLKRTITGGFFVALVLVAFRFGEVSTFILSGVVITIGLVEFFKMFHNEDQVSIPFKFAIFSGLLIFVTQSLSLLSTSGEAWLSVKVIELLSTVVLILLVVFLLIFELFRNKKNPIPNVSTVIFGWLYLIVPFTLLLKIQVDFSKEAYIFLWGLFILVWSNDTFAYLSGRAFGKTKLFERISPKKTWEGTIGGVVFTFVSAFLFSYLSATSVVFWMCAVPIVSFGSIFGDLFESALKRSVNCKDSGNILPGHGGVLDRFDAVIFAIPLFYIWLACYY